MRMAEAANYTAPLHTPRDPQRRGEGPEFFCGLTKERGARWRGMPHDKKGNLLVIGDRISLLGLVKSIDSEQPTYCNITILAEIGMEPSQDGTDAAPTYCLSARMVEKLELATTGAESSPTAMELNASLGRDVRTLETLNNRAQAHAKNVLRNRSEFERHEVLLAVVNAFISGADHAVGGATGQPQHEIIGAAGDDLQRQLRSSNAEIERVIGENRQLRADVLDLSGKLTAAMREGNRLETEIKRFKMQPVEVPPPFTLDLTKPGELKTPEDEKARGEVLGTGATASIEHGGVVIHDSPGSTEIQRDALPGETGNSAPLGTAFQTGGGTSVADFDTNSAPAETANKGPGADSVAADGAGQEKAAVDATTAAQ